MPGDIINSNDADYIMQQIRERHLRTTTVTIVMIGKETWGRKFVDWEIAASLRNTKTTTASGLLAINLPSVQYYSNLQIPRTPSRQYRWKSWLRTLVAIPT